MFMGDPEGGLQGSTSERSKKSTFPKRSVQFSAGGDGLFLDACNSSIIRPHGDVRYFIPLKNKHK
jgi:hypothetical protein